MKLPRDLSGTELAALLHNYGYDVTRQTGSHLRLTSRIKGKEHHISIPRHSPLKVGTLSTILADVASYLETDRSTLLEELFRS
ncbi:MAG: YcfA family protein [Dehalococcoidia bacterium]|nr:YcfA family protein [Dehalococcoidia bacterium]